METETLIRYSRKPWLIGGIRDFNEDGFSDGFLKNYSLIRETENLLSCYWKPWSAVIGNPDQILLKTPIIYYWKPWLKEGILKDRLFDL